MHSTVDGFIFILIAITFKFKDEIVKLNSYMYICNSLHNDVWKKKIARWDFLSVFGVSKSEKKNSHSERPEPNFIIDWLTPILT